MAKIQDFTTEHKNGEIHKTGRGFEYRSKSGKTVRYYETIKELIEGERGTKNTQAQPDPRAEPEPAVLEETTEEDS